jgi:hypothetical protein
LSLQATDLLGQVETGMTKVKTCKQQQIPRFAPNDKDAKPIDQPERRLLKEQIPHGLKAVRDDNLEIPESDIAWVALNSSEMPRKRPSSQPYLRPSRNHFHKKCPSCEGRERSGEEIEITETNLLRQ